MFARTKGADAQRGAGGTAVRGEPGGLAESFLGSQAEQAQPST
jgi:hypothetical protein